MNKIMLVFGTRPEAIKMCPLVNELKKRKNIKTIVCVTGQHREMLNQVLECFSVIPDYNFNIMQENQTLFDVLNKIMLNIKNVLEKEKPDILLVHGDTSTTFASAVAGYYLKIPIGHIEAGLRTYNIYSPYPEEFNRQATSIVAKYNFAPTEDAKKNLIAEGKTPNSIYVTGNTVIDALKTTVQENYYHPILEELKNNKIIILTVHRRENLGKPMENIFKAVNKITTQNKNVKIIYPVHKNPIIQKQAKEILGNNESVRLIEPLDVFEFHNFLNKSYLIMTDSGGIQEEATALRKPVLVLRNTTERNEGVENGILKLVGTNTEKICKEVNKLLKNKEEYEKMRKNNNIYGDGYASKRIVDILEEKGENL